MICYARQDKWRNANKQWFEELKAGNKCARCPEDSPACLDFHHIDPATKFKAVTLMVCQGYSRKRILEELAKCEALCANCHRKEHAKRRLLVKDS